MPAQVDPTAVLPFELLVHILQVGRFTAPDLAPVRLVCRAMCAAASDASFYRTLAVRIPRLDEEQIKEGNFLSTYVAGLPPHATRGVTDFKLRKTEWLQYVSVEDLAAAMRLLPLVAILDAWNCFETGTNALWEAMPPHLVALNVGGLPGGADFSGLPARFERLESLVAHNVHEPHRAIPFGSLRRLRRLVMKDAFMLDHRKLLEAVATAPCAGILVALSLRRSMFVRECPQVDPAFLAPVVDGRLPALREFDLGLSRSATAGAEAAIAAAFASLDRLKVFGLVTDSPELCAALVAGDALPPNLTALHFKAEYPVGAAAFGLVEVLPVSLTHLEILFSSQCPSATEMAAVLSRCPALETFCTASVASDTPTVLIDAATGGRSLEVSIGTTRTAKEAMKAAGITVLGPAEGMVDVRWRLS